ncbi:MAG: DUF3306 domain-containing protein [Candidatus Competibacterales bacterium]|nr:DUF3306 domain-containing protein [Candidatus Competibacterales bacterium]
MSDETEYPGRVSFLERWSSRKRRAGAAQDELPEVTRPVAAEPSAPEPEPLTDADMPALESLDENADVSMFFSPKVSPELRRLALRKLFHQPKFNLTDGLNDYDLDYTRYTPLGDLVTAEMRHRIEVEAQRLRERQAAAERDPSPAEAGPEATGDDDTPPSETASSDETSRGEPT